MDMKVFHWKEKDMSMMLTRWDTLHRPIDQKVYWFIVLSSKRSNPEPSKMGPVTTLLNDKRLGLNVFTIGAPTPQMIIKATILQI